ncbi:MAG: glycosyltransferase family 4 protein [Chloroflexi bacterium]|nr:glycosyltransferase family 4 protein [Chloroflexota bacterium]
MANAWYLIAVFAVVALGSWLIVDLIRALAHRFNILDIPNARSSHTRPMPLCGGLAIVCMTVAAWVYIGFVRPAVTPRHTLAYIAGALLIAGVSLVDDLGHVPYPIRFCIQGAAAAIFLAGYASWNVVTVPLLGSVALGAAGLVLSFLWIVGLTNAFNFMDGVDGMAAGQAVAAGLGWAALGWLAGWHLLVILGLVIAAASLGFLAHNWYPATIFMGDVGSTFLGYSFAVLPIVAARYDSRLALVGVLMMWPTIFDSGFTVLDRLRRRQNIFAGHREFLFHRLVAAGWGHSQAATLYLTFPILGACLAFTWDRGTPVLHLGVVLLLAGSCLSLWLLVRHQEGRAPVQEATGRTLSAGRHLAIALDGGAGALHAGIHPITDLVPQWRVKAERPSVPPTGASAWDGVERRSGRDRRAGSHQGPAAGPTVDRREGRGRRATDRLPRSRPLGLEWSPSESYARA